MPNLLAPNKISSSWLGQYCDTFHRNRCLPETKKLIKKEFRGDGGVYKILPIK
jgi:hypothetical protein